MSDRSDRHARVVAHAEHLRREDRDLPQRAAETLAARDLFPRQRRPLPQHPKGKLRTTDEQKQIQADFAKRNRAA